jgi:SAM-dependent methyltransferase
MISTSSAFDRAGFAALADYTAADYAPIFAALDGVQAEFNEKLPQFRDPEYRWDIGRDLLRTWARSWEYVYAYHHIRAERARRGRALAVADFGSGSTFFPIAVARLGIDLTCLDIDPVCVRDMDAAARSLGVAPGSLQVKQSDERLPLGDASVDLAYSVSVLEHMPDPVPIVAELARILAPGGLLVVTLDIDVEGDEGVSPAHFDALRAQLGERFEWVYGERTIHPLDTLTSKSSPYPRPGEEHHPGLLWRTKDRRMLPLFGGPNPGILTVYGAVLRRR